MENNLELTNELRELKQDRERWKVELLVEQNRMANLLKHEMGEDINNVLSGKVQVKEKWTTQLKFKIKCFFDKIFNVL